MFVAAPTDIATRRAAAFHIGTAYWDCWSAAFGDGAVREIGGVRVRPGRMRLGPMRLATLEGATNPHSMGYDAAPDAVLADDLPDRLFAATGAARLRFDYLDAEARLMAAAAGWRGRYRVEIAPHALAPVADCTRPQADWLAGRSKRVRQLLRRGEKELLGARGMRLELATHDPTRDGLLDAMLRVEASGWKGREGTAILDSAAETRFYTDLARAAAAAGVLQLALLWDGAALVAFEYGVIGGDRLFLLKVGFDEAFADHSPGHLLAAWHIGCCCADPGLSTYDKMGNGMTPAPYKLRFADRCDTRLRLTVYAPTAAGRLARLADGARAQAKARRDAWRAARREKAGEGA